MLEKIKNYNCHYKSHIKSYILPKCCKEKEPKHEQLCIAVHTITNHICDASSLDNSSNKACKLGTALHNMGVVWDLKNKTGNPYK